MRKLLLILVLLKGIAINAQTIKLDKKRTVEIIGSIGFNIIESAKKLNKLSLENKKDIFLLINSPGGSVATGTIFISAMTMAKARGVKVKCVVPVYAASMAFSIMLNCSENYVLAGTQLLFHPVRIGLMAYLTAYDAKKIYDNLLSFDIPLLELLYKTFQADTNEMKEKINIAFVEEKWWNADELLEFINNKSFITIVNNIEGNDNIFELESDTDKMRRKELEQSFDVIYIAPTLPREGVN